VNSRTLSPKKATTFGRGIQHVSLNRMTLANGYEFSSICHVATAGFCSETMTARLP